MFRCLLRRIKLALSYVCVCVCVCLCACVCFSSVVWRYFSFCFPFRSLFARFCVCARASTPHHLTVSTPPPQGLTASDVTASRITIQVATIYGPCENYKLGCNSFWEHIRDTTMHWRLQQVHQHDPASMGAAPGTGPTQGCLL